MTIGVLYPRSRVRPRANNPGPRFACPGLSSLRAFSPLIQSITPFNCSFQDQPISEPLFRRPPPCGERADGRKEQSEHQKTKNCLAHFLISDILNQ